MIPTEIACALLEVDSAPAAIGRVPTEGGESPAEVGQTDDEIAFIRRVIARFPIEKDKLTYEVHSFPIEVTIPPYSVTTLRDTRGSSTPGANNSPNGLGSPLAGIASFPKALESLRNPMASIQTPLAQLADGFSMTPKALGGFIVTGRHTPALADNFPAAVSTPPEAKSNLP